MCSATMNWNGASRRMRRPSSTLVPSSRTTTGTCDAAELLDGADHAARDAVRAGDAAEDVDQHGAHVGVGDEQAERVLDRLLAGAAADVEEVGRLAAVELDDVHRGHGEAGAVDHAGDVAVELDVVQVELRRLDLHRVLLVEVAHLHDVRVAEEGVVVEVDLGVERHHVARAGDHQRIDLGERRVRLQIGVHEPGDQLRGLGRRLPFEAEAAGHGAGLERQDAEVGIDRQPEDLLRMRGRDLLDVHAAGRRGHDHRLALGAVERDREVELLGDVGGLLDQHLADELPFGAGLVGDELHAEDLRRVPRGPPRATWRA